MLKLERLWEYDEIPECGTSSCPLFDLSPDASDDIIAYTKRECLCQEPEYLACKRHSHIFLWAQEAHAGTKAGLPPPPEIDYDHIYRAAFIAFDREMEFLKGRMADKERDKNGKGNQRES